MELSRTVFSAQDIRAATARLAAEIDRDFVGQEVLFVGVLKGAFIFLADLIREVNVPCAVDFVRVSSYGAGTCTSGIVEEKISKTESVHGRHVVVVEEIVDSGTTLCTLLERLAREEPASLSVCALVDKTERRALEIPIRYRGFELSEGFLVGYGLDFGERYRNLPDIHLLEP